MKKILSLMACTLLMGSLFAMQLPDSIRQLADAEPRIARGFTFDIQGSVGLGGFTASGSQTSSLIGYPDWSAGIGVNYYFLPYMGIGVGVDYALYRRRIGVDGPFVASGVDYQGQAYTLTATPHQLSERQRLGYLEVPLLLRFRAIPRKVGFQGGLGVKLAFPMWADYEVPQDGQLLNSVYYPHWDLTMSNVPTVIENQPISAMNDRVDCSELTQLNYVGYAELGVLFQLARRVDMSLTAYGSYFILPVASRQTASGPMGYGKYSVGEYDSPFVTDYHGLLHTSELADYRPWSVGLKVGVHFNAGWTEAERRYRKEERRRRAQERANRRSAETDPVLFPVPVVDSDPVLPAEDDSLAMLREQFMADSVAARADIIRLAAQYHIDLCDLCAFSTIYVHDTVFVRIDQAPEPVMTASQELDEVLSGAVIWFEFDKTDPILEPSDVLIRIAQTLRRHPDMHICVNGHACIVGKADYNRRLALRRAEAVRDRLLDLGVKAEQMSVHTLGSDSPYRYQNTHQLAKDRRVEIIPDCSDESTASFAPTDTLERVTNGARLASIARRHYGNTDYWTYIWQANKDILPDPNCLKTGMLLRLPSLAEIEQMKK